MIAHGGARAVFERSVFINCPFDQDYLSLLRPLLFTITALGFRPRIASERSDSGEMRLDKIVGLIRSARFSEAVGLVLRVRLRVLRCPTE